MMVNGVYAEKLSLFVYYSTKNFHLFKIVESENFFKQKLIVDFAILNK